MVAIAAESGSDLPKRLAAFIGGVLLALLLSFSLVATVPGIQRWVARTAGLNTEPTVIVKRVRVPVTQVAQCERPEPLARAKGVKRLAAYKKGKPRVVRRAARRLPLCGVDPGVTPSEYGLSEARDPRTSSADPFTNPIGEAFEEGLVEPTELAQLATPFGPALITPVTSGGLPTPQPIAVPEPESWAQMIVGLGAVGAMVRIRRSSNALRA